MDTTSDIQIEQTPFTFRGDEQALRAVVDRAIRNLRGLRISYYPIDPGTESINDAAWIERYTETVRGVEVRRLRAIWIGAGPSFSYRCAYIDRADDDDAARIELRQRGIRQRADESASMRLHIKLSPVQAAATTGRIEAPSLLRFAVDAILQAIEEAGREAPTVTPTGDAPSESTPRAGGNPLGLSGKTLALAELLAQGVDRRSAADKLNLAPTTIDGYAKEIARRVTNQSEEVLKPNQLQKKLRDMGYDSPHMGG